MNQDFAMTWRLVRDRFDTAIQGLNQEQLNWRLHPGTLSIGEMAVHVAGVEVFFTSQMLGRSLEGETARFAKAATDGSINDNPFPYSTEELTPEFVAERLAEGRAAVEPVITNLTDELRAVTLVSALGPIIDGAGAMARLAYHPGYHQAQVYMISSAPGFPKVLDS